MKKTLFTLILSAALAPISIWPGTLNPSPPLQVENDNSVNSSVPLAQTNGSGISLLIWQDDVQEVLAALSPSNQANWSNDSPVLSSGSSSAYPFLAGNAQGFLLAWIQPDPGWSSGIPYSKFYNTASQTWGPSIPIDSSITNAFVALFVQSTPQGFLATFRDGSGNLWANLSPDGINWQPMSQLLLNTEMSGISVYDLTGCGNDSLLLITWTDTGSGDIYVTTSTDGTSWSNPTIILSGVVQTFNSGCTGCFANSKGFLISYSDNSGTLWSIFSADGVNWSTPSQIVASQPIFYAQTPLISGNDSGFVTAWVDGSGTGFASFSGDNGQTWEDPVQFTQTMALIMVPFDFYDLGISVYQDICIFSWGDTFGNPYVSTSPFPNSGSSGNNTWGFTSPIIFNKPGKPL